MAEAEAGEDTRGKLHSMILVVVKADEKRLENDGTLVAISRIICARPHLTADGNFQPQRREACFASPLALYGIEKWQMAGGRAVVIWERARRRMREVR
jgi:hypothetical protein